ncbi:ABC transporter ATP-binding protein [Sphingobium sp. H39-3-25]|uniref:ABC transporter ATP-binding protein n=1 Tax=Sphingobium arseniciresistens TaxID=3030834 RepID=UPI0023B9C037|nr:ABC transporter ATP-binding protein [Sphingobium arseniciresistens]
MNNSILEVKDLRKTHGDFVAVDDISFSMPSGEFLTLLGPSGSGKTTTLQMITGLTSVSAGEIRLDDKPVHRLPPYRRNIGVVFQNYALFQHMTVAKNVAFPLEVRKVPASEIQRRVEETLETVGLPGFGNRYPAQLSGGQQQRVALARAMIFRPRLLLMDEPLGALDKKLREQIQLEIVRLHRETGMTIVYVTHDQDEALVMSDRIAVFNKGKIEQVGTANDIYENPQSLFISGFIGDSNFIPIDILGRQDGYLAGRAGSSLLRGRGGDQISVGQKATLVVRPERVHVSTDVRASDGMNSVTGQLKTVVYLGKSRKYVIAAEGGVEIVALKQCVQGASDPQWPEGTQVVAHWEPTESTILSS